MRTLLCLLIISLMAGSNLTVTNARAQVTFSAGLEINSVGDFYTPLAAYGSWVDVGTYGRCWRPTGVSEGWRPYSSGSWEWTDLGWYWVSDEPWAWACYHYGTWVYDPTYGWLWIPGTEWAPAWVAWRESSEYIGWAPCTFDNTVIAPSLFVFVDIHHFHHRIRPDTLIVNNTTVVQQTQFVRNLNRQKHHFDGVAKTVVVNSGPSVGTIERASGTRITARPIGEVVTQTQVPESIKRNPIGKSGIETPQPTGREQPRTYAKPSDGNSQMTNPSETKPSQTTPSQPTPQATPPTTPSQTTTPSQVRPPETTPQIAPPATAPQPPLPPTGREQPRIYTTPSQATPPQTRPLETAPQWTPPAPRPETMPPSTAPAQPRTVSPSPQTTLPQSTMPSEPTPQIRPSTPQPNVAPSITPPSQSAPVQTPPTLQPPPPTGREQGANPGSQIPPQQFSPSQEQRPASPGPSERPEASPSGQQRQDNKND